MYQPKFPPTSPDAKALSEYVASEFQAVAQSQSDSLDSITLNILSVLPKKPREGQVCYFDGVNVNPGGTGKGFYGYSGTAWVKF